MTFAFFLESVGGGEWLVLLAVILVVVGPKNLPSAARKIGQIMSQLRRAADEFKRQLMTMDEEVHKAVDDVKKEYMDVGEEVKDTVESDGSAPEGDIGSSDGGYSEDGSSDVPPYDEDSDRAMWEDYGREYDPDGIYGYSDDDTSSGEETGEASASSDTAPETASSDTASGSAENQSGKEIVS